MQNNVVQNIENIRLGTEIVELKDRELIDKKKMYLSFKRASDVVFSLMGLVALIPLGIIVGIMIKLDSKGPVLLKQERIGKDGKVFKMYKYRSMVDGADEILKGYLESNEEAKKEYQEYKKLKNDPRVTRVGAFIRKTSIDELPQLINVLKGDMSLVGPRPYLVREKEDMKDYYPYIIKSKPGITGLWQVSGRSQASFAERLDLDYTYNQSKNMKMDCKLLLKTFAKIVKKEGAM